MDLSGSLTCLKSRSDAEAKRMSLDEETRRALADGYFKYFMKHERQLYDDGVNSRGEQYYIAAARGFVAFYMGKYEGQVEGDGHKKVECWL